MPPWPCPAPGEAHGTNSSAAPCQGYDCLLQYVQKDDGMFSWTDTGLRLNGTNDALLPKLHVGTPLDHAVISPPRIIAGNRWITPQLRQLPL